ncbi:hypothetical protein [Halalkalibacter alkaliphilus]|uniref:Uncharacterized protein n=1 Tax=Halalkalibacter alkaliphilus TaxID=2917993 RepID=A0A9X2CSN1_9BACI|nr:hypothetical protein [Halalkalibacter alkaliphilus]MCL7747332.1 hypothetical protein [Halalkalibacter alkaliphilus]
MYFRLVKKIPKKNEFIYDWLKDEIYKVDATIKGTGGVIHNEYYDSYTGEYHIESTGPDYYFVLELVEEGEEENLGTSWKKKN